MRSELDPGGHVGTAYSCRILHMVAVLLSARRTCPVTPGLADVHFGAMEGVLSLKFRKKRGNFYLALVPLVLKREIVSIFTVEVNSIQ